MKTDGVVAVRRRRSRAEGKRLVSEFEHSGLGRKEFCAARGLNVHTLDAWCKQVRQSGCGEEFVPVEIIEDREARRDTRLTASTGWSGQFRNALDGAALYGSCPQSE